MADFDPDAYLKKIKKPDPPPASDDYIATGAKDFGRGLAKGVVRFADEIPTLGTPHVSELDPRVKQFEEETPNAPPAEKIGAFAGENAPFLVGGPEAAIGKGVARAIPIAGRFAKPVGEFVGHSLWSGAAGAAQPVQPGESRLTNALGGAATGGLLSPTVAGKAAGLLGAGGTGYGVEQLARVFGWGPVITALAGLGIGAGHFGHGGLTSLARTAFRTAEKPTRAASEDIPAGLKGAAGGRAAESAQETYDANQPGPAQGQ